MACRNSTSSPSTCEVVDVDSGRGASAPTSTAGEATGRGRRVRKPTRRDDEIVQTLARTRRRATVVEQPVAAGSTARTTKARRGRPNKAVVQEEEERPMQPLDVDDEQDEDDSQATVRSTSTVAQQLGETPEMIQPMEVPAPAPAPASAPEPMLEPSPSSPPPPPPSVPVNVDVAPQPKQLVAASSPPPPTRPTEVIILPATSSSSQPDLDNAPSPQPSARARPRRRRRPPPQQPPPQSHRHDSDSDEVDDFFMRRKPAPFASRALNSSAAGGGKGRRAPMRRPGGGTTSKSASLDPDAANAKAGPSTSKSPSKKHPSPRLASTPSPLPSDSSSSSSSDIEFIEDPGGPTLDFGNCKINLPSWARQSSPGKLNGNNKRDRSVSNVPPAEAKGKRKGKGRAEKGDSSSDGFVIARDEGADHVGARKRKKKKGRSGTRSSTERSRSRSRSLTPPDEVSGEVLQQILRAAHGELGASLDFNSSPLKDDERSRHSSVDSADADLPPEMHELRSKHLLRAPTQDPLTGASSSTHEVDVVAPSESIQLSVRFALEADVTASARATLWAQPWSTKMDSDAQFGDVFKSVSARYGVREEDLVLTFRGRRVYRFGTPRSLKMCGEGEENEVWAYRFEVWEEVEELRRKRIEVEDEKEDEGPPEGVGMRGGGEQLLLSEGDEDGDEVMGVGTSRGLGNGDAGVRSSPLLDLFSSTAGAREPDSPDQDELIRLTVRGGPKSSFGFAVKPTFSLRKVLAWYCKKQGIVDPQRIAGMSLQWDGEKLDLDQTVADIDEFEFEDTLDVKG